MVKLFVSKVIALFVGFFTIFKHSFKKPVTVKYPEQKIDIPNEFRGLHSWHSNKCCGCHLCEKVCPTGAIKIEYNQEKNKFSIDLKKCIFCGNCMYYCKNKAIEMTNKFDLATDDKSNLTFEINALKSNELGNIMD